jgi:hypothetical protein
MKRGGSGKRGIHKVNNHQHRNKGNYEKKIWSIMAKISEK